MSSTPIIPIISAALVGSVAAVVTSVVLSTDGDGISARIVDDEPDMAELRVEVASLQARNDDLTSRLTDLEGQIALGSSRMPADAPDLTAMQEQMNELIAATTESGPVIVTAQLRSGVTAVLDEIQLQEDLEREVRRQEARDRRMDQQIERLSERLSLDSVQTGEVRSILTKQDLKREEPSPKATPWPLLTAFMPENRSAGWPGRRPVASNPMLSAETDVEPLATRPAPPPVEFPQPTP